ncbi:MAG: flavodoxin [Eubacteriales bacterium]|nr:flavodoxin [Eubacteriales bacterium]
MKSIILYYSRSGNTEKLAKRIQGDIGCEAIKIEPEQAYGNYLESVGRVKNERGKGIIPTFITPIPNLRDYDVILLGFPIWAQDVPSFVAEFVRRCDIKRKTIIPFATYGMSNIQWTMKTLNELCLEANMKLPFDQGMFKKRNYDEWIAKVKALLQ